MAMDQQNINEGFQFEIAHSLFCSCDVHETQILKGIEFYNKMVHVLTDRCRGLADLLDAKEAERANEIETMQCAHDAKLNEMKDQIKEQLTLLSNLNDDNQ